MAEKDEDSPQLELPSFGFGRKRKKRDPATEEPVAPEPEPGPVVVAPEPVAPEPEPEPEPEPVVAAAAAAPEPDPEPMPEYEPAAETTTTRLEPVEPPAAAEPTRAPLFVDEVAETATGSGPRTTTETRIEPTPEPAPDGGERKAEKPHREVRLPAISGMAAAIITGLLVGVLTVGATWGSLRLCEVLQGAPSCGNPGFVLLVAILVAMVLVGSLLLRAWGVPDPTSTSFLAVALMAVLALLFLVDVLLDWWMIIAIPLVSVLTFALSHWVTTRLVEPAKD
jgi:hypothetical protein